MYFLSKFIFKLSSKTGHFRTYVDMNFPLFWREELTHEICPRILDTISVILDTISVILDTISVILDTISVILDKISVIHTFLCTVPNIAKYRNTNLMFCCPCIVIYPYNENQQDALFAFNLFQ